MFYGLASSVGSGRFELIEPKGPVSFWEESSVKVMSLNVCFQDPWSPLTGGVVPPFEPVGDYPTRISAIVDAIARENPQIFLGQEFDDFHAQEECIGLMQERGFSYFVRDLGSPNRVCNHSGLFVASKLPLQNVEFVPYPPGDKVGLAKWAAQGALTFTVDAEGRELRLINVHLNYGTGKENQEARNRQLIKYVVPLLNRGNSVLFGDLNFDTSTVDSKVSGLVGFINALEGQVTCTDKGKHTLWGKSLTPGGLSCPECEEKIDALLYRPEDVRVQNVRLQPLRVDEELLSDHYATSATISSVDK